MTLRHGRTTDLFPSDGTSPSARAEEAKHPDQKLLLVNCDDSLRLTQHSCARIFWP
jgi:hypothetical protein